MKAFQKPLPSLLAGAIALGAMCAPARAELAISAVEKQLYPGSDPIADAVCATLKKDANNIYLWRATWDRTDLYYGPADNPQQNPITWKLNKDIFSIPSTLQPSVKVSFNPLPTSSSQPAYRMVNFYLKNVYKISSTELLGLIHLEYMAWIKKSDGLYHADYFTHPDGSMGADHYAIGVAYSSDLGRTWKFDGDAIRTSDKTPNLATGNIGGAAFVVNGLNMYVYYNEKSAASPNSYPAVARARIVDVVNSAREGYQNKYWKKYSAATRDFTEDGLTGLGSQIIPGVGMDMHSDAAYCTALKQYLVTVNEGGPASTLALYRSKDGINWIRARTLALGRTGGDGKWHAPCYPYFASTRSDANDDNSVVGKEFSINFISQANPTNNQWNYYDQPIFNLKVKIADQLPVSNMLQ